MIDKEKIIEMVVRCDKPFEIKSLKEWAVDIVITALEENGYEIVKKG